ncbi:hypothetical protein [Mycolicibacterium brisbanense]
MRQTILKTVLTGVATTAVIGGAAACSSNQPHSGQISSSAASSAATSAAPESAAPDAYGQCMEEHGMPAPPGGFGQRPPGHPDGPPPDGATPPEGAPPAEPPPGHHGDGATPPPPPGVDQDAWNNALQACASLAPTPPPQ